MINREYKVLGRSLRLSYADIVWAYGMVIMVIMQTFSLQLTFQPVHSLYLVPGLKPPATVA